MKIVLLESLGIPENELNKYAQELVQEGHSFCYYEKNTNPAVQMERAKDADVIMLLICLYPVRLSDPVRLFVSLMWHLPVWIMWIWKPQRKNASL